MSRQSLQALRVAIVGSGREAGASASAVLDGSDGVATETATGAGEGIELVRNHQPDCVVSAYELPDGDGIELLRTVREEFPELPFVLCTDEGDEALASEAISAGVTDYVRAGPGVDWHDSLADSVRSAARDRQERQRTERQRELMRLTETAGDTGGFEIDVEANELVITEGASRISGLSDETTHSLDEALSLYPPDDRADLRQTIDRVVETGEQTRGVWRYRPVGQDDTERLVEVTLTPVTTAGETTAIRGAVRDVTDRHERREELGQIETLFQHAQDALFLVDVGEEFTIERVNRAFEEMTGVSAAELRGQTPTEWLGEQGETIEERYRECIECREPIQYEEQHRFGDDLVRRETRLAPVVIDGAVEYIAGSTRDVTEQRERRREIDRLEQAVESANVGLTLADPNREDTPLTYVNDAFEEMTGYSEAEAVGRNCRFLQGEGTDPEKVAAVREALESDEPVTVEFRNYRKDGTEFWNRLTLTPIYEDGDLVRYLGTQEDITERKEGEQKLAAERQFVEQALDTLDDIFYVLDVDGSMRRWNDSVPEVTGHSEAALADMQAVELFPEDDQQTVADGIETALSEERATIEAEILTADGERIPYEFTGARLADTDGNTTGVVGIGRDVTERRQRERRFRALVEESNDVITVVDEDGQLQYQSPTVERILGYDPGGMVGEMAWTYLHPDDRERVRETFTGWITSTDEPRRVAEFRVRDADGSWRWMEARGYDRHDSPVDGYVINTQDITERKERQEQLELLDRVLRHNLRNDLNIILGHAETLVGRSSGQAADSAERIVETSEQVLNRTENQRQITDLLRSKPAQKNLELRPLLRQVVTRIDSTHPDASLTVQCPSDVTVRVIKNFGQALEELVTNAVVHNDSPSPTVEITVSQTPERVSIAVADDGPQIPEMERNVLTDQDERTPLYHGRGLGLWLVKLVVARSGGTIDFEERSPTGNVVRLELPN